MSEEMKNNEATSGPESNQKPLTVMVVDDMELIRKSIIGALEPYDIDVVSEAVNGQEAIEILDDIDVDIILLDVVMPIMQGPEALPIIRTLCPDALIIMLTSTRERSLVVECRDAGANGYVLKNDKMSSSLYKNIMLFWDKRDQKYSINS